MGFLNQLRETTPRVSVPELKSKPVLIQAPGDPAAFVQWAELEARRIAELPESRQPEALIAFDEECKKHDKATQNDP